MPKNDPKKATGTIGNGDAAKAKADVDARRRFLDRSMEGSAIVRGTVKGTLPEIAAPSLEALTIHLDAPKPVTREVLLERLEQVIYTVATRLPRKYRDMVEPDDEIIVDTIGYCDGALVPFSVHEQLKLTPIHEEVIPGLRDQLVGELVGTTVQVLLPIHDRHPYPELRGKLAAYSVRIMSAAELQVHEPGSPEFLKRVNAGATVEAVLERLVSDLNEEQRVRQWNKALSDLLVELASRANVTIDESIIDHEIRRKWREHEGSLMARLNLPLDQQNAALNAWLEDSELRKELNREIATATVLNAVAKKENLLNPEEIGPYFDALMPAFGLDPKAVRASLAKDPKSDDAREFAANLLFLRAAEHIWSRATVQRS